MRFCSYLLLILSALAPFCHAENKPRPTPTKPPDTARSYFEHGRKLNFPAAGAAGPYVLHASFVLPARMEPSETGTYVDTWISEDHWRREAWIRSSHYVRAQNGAKRYELSQGIDANLLKLVMRAMEPLPALDTFVESDWNIKRDTINDTATIRVLTGPEDADGAFDPTHTRAYWFDASGKLVKVYHSAFEMQRSDFFDFHGVQIARHIDLIRGPLKIPLDVTDVSAATSIPADTFILAGREAARPSTDEAR